MDGKCVGRKEGREGKTRGQGEDKVGAEKFKRGRGRDSKEKVAEKDDEMQEDKWIEVSLSVYLMWV